MSDLKRLQKALNDMSLSMADIGTAMHVFVDKFSISMSHAAQAIGRAFRNTELNNLECGAVDDDTDLYAIYDSLMLAKTHDDIMTILKRNEYPGTLLKIFIDLGVIEMCGTSSLAIKNNL